VLSQGCKLLTFRTMLIRVAPTRAKALRCLVIAAFLGAALPAQAQIYTWRDANGNLVLSNTRPGASAPTVASYTVPKAEGVRATRSALAGRARAFDDLIAEHSRTQGVRPDLIRAVMQVESGFNPYARSPKGAMGLMQLMPATAKQYGVRDAFNPTENVRAGVAYLRELLDRYQNDEALALAAYNAGPGAVDRHGQTVPPYRETQSYVANINKIAARPIEVRNNALYKVTERTADGRDVILYTDKKPAIGAFQVVATRP
jgi:soluble lytic murein transglycosylase-like protein